MKFKIKVTRKDGVCNEYDTLGMSSFLHKERFLFVIDNKDKSIVEIEVKKIKQLEITPL